MVHCCPKYSVGLVSCSLNENHLKLYFEDVKLATFIIQQILMIKSIRETSELVMVMAK